MGQRSQIYVRYGKKLVVANYYQWNFGERMVSRARYGIEYIKDAMIENRKWIFGDQSYIMRLSRVFDVNFDMKDVTLSTDIVKEWKEYDPDIEFNKYSFRGQDNNDGVLLVDISDDGAIKYAFLDFELNSDNIMNAENYMDWDCENWRISEYIDDEQKKLLHNNIEKIDEMASLMSREEVEDFMLYDYTSQFT